MEWKGPYIFKHLYLLSNMTRNFQAIHPYLRGQPASFLNLNRKWRSDWVFKIVHRRWQKEITQNGKRERNLQFGECSNGRECAANVEYRKRNCTEEELFEQIFTVHGIFDVNRNFCIEPWRKITHRCLEVDTLVDIFLSGRWSSSLWNRSEQ